MTISLEKVLEEELQQVETSRNLRLGHDARRSARESLVGLAFSGGGIRSATFNLGIIQAFARSRLLRTFDYLSTVSGGAYIGGWLMAWMRHQRIGILNVEERFSTTPDSPGQWAEPPEVLFLRNYSGYLRPRKDLLGADFWAFVAGRLRNVFSNQSILFLALLSLLLAPRAFVSVLKVLEVLEEVLQGRFPGGLQTYLQSEYFALGLGLTFSFIALLFIGLNLVSLDPRRGQTSVIWWFTNPWAVQTLIVVPLILSAAFLTYGLGQFLTAWKLLEYPLYRLPLLGIALYFGPWAGALAVRSTVRVGVKTAGSHGGEAWFMLATAAVTGAIYGYLLIPFARVLIPVGAPPGTVFNKWREMTFGTPVLIGTILIASLLHIVLMGRGFSDVHREWWGRLGGWLVIYALCWFSLFVVAVYVPASLGQLFRLEQSNRYFYHPITFTGALAWAVAAVYKLIFEKSDQAGKMISDTSFRKKLLRYSARVAPYVYITGLAVGLSLLASTIANWITGSPASILDWPSDLDLSLGLPLASLLFFVAALILSWRVDVNEFSANYLHRNRIIRFYLGPSVLGRPVQPFTGYGLADDLPLASLQIQAGSEDPRDARPIPIVNATLNVVRGRDLVLQRRVARSFAFTPLYGGFTRHRDGQVESYFGATALAGVHRDGITLGTSIAISAATARPDIGSYSQRPLAFLMTMFDVRRGWWIGNPAGAQWQRGSPAVGFYWLLRELLGATTDTSKYLNLSDGGYFENLGIYELVRRGCKLIVGCDASCDPNSDLADLYNAMERCRADFGVEITLADAEALKPTGLRGEMRSKVHFVHGAIRYPDPQQGHGAIIYIKPTLVEGDPQDVLAYAKVNPEFPHDATDDHWFDEASFEKYRALGEAAGASAAEAIRAGIRDFVNN
jgi:hypothetical protein